MVLPAFADAWLRAERSSDAAVLLATITHSSWETLRLAKNTDDVVSRGLTFTKTFFNTDLVTDNDQVPRVVFSIPNIDPEIGRRISRVIDPPEVTLEVISLAYPDEPIERVARLQLRNVTINPIEVSGELWGYDYSSEPVGTIAVTPTNFPAMFRRRG